MPQNIDLYSRHTLELISYLSGKKLEQVDFSNYLEKKVQDFVSEEDLNNRSIDFIKKYNLDKIKLTDNIQTIVKRMYCFRPF